MARDNTRNDGKGGDKGPRRFSFSFSPAGLVSLAVVAAAALAWAFVLGVLVGRGYKPESAVPELEKIMPRAEQNATAPAEPDVLKAEELDFYDNLSRKPESAAAKSRKPQPEAAPEAAAPVAEPATPQAAPKAEAAAPPAAPNATPDTTDGERFRYVYQVASLRNPEMAGQFAARLRKMGMDTSIETSEVDGKAWHRVLVHFTGTPEATRALKDSLATVGVEKPIMKSKQPL